jgi:hypothetical protein
MPESATRYHGRDRLHAHITAASTLIAPDCSCRAAYLQYAAGLCSPARPSTQHGWAMPDKAVVGPKQSLSLTCSFYKVIGVCCTCRASARGWQVT